MTELIEFVKVAPKAAVVTTGSWQKAQRQALKAKFVNSES